MKTILITGANRGLGLESVHQFLKGGYKVYATCRVPADATSLQALGAEWPEMLTVLPLVVNNSDSIEALAKELESAGVELDILLNNAGIGGDAFYGEPTFDDMMGIYEINTVGPLMVTRAVYPFIKKGAGSVIANMSSLLGSLTNKFILQKGGYGYSASKAALNMVTCQMSLDYAEDGVIAIALSPGWVKTDMGGEEAPLTAPESIEGLKAIIEKVTQEDSGSFWHYDHTKLPW